MNLLSQNKEQSILASSFWTFIVAHSMKEAKVWLDKRSCMMTMTFQTTLSVTNE
jgi:hypothetical protein